MHGFGIALSGNHIFLMLIGVLLGIVVGVLPGLGAPNGVSLLLPLTFGMQPVSAIILLSSMYWGALFGALVGVVLITFSASWVAEVALQFGPAEYFAVYLLAFSSFIGMGGAPAFK